MYKDRYDAGRQLANAMAGRRSQWSGIVLALPRGGVPVGFEIAHRLDLPLDICLVRKLGLPAQPELAIGAIAEGGVLVLNDDLVRRLRVTSATIERIAEDERRELDRRSIAYRGTRNLPDLRGQTVILADDGCATGANMCAAIQAAGRAGAAWIIVAVPVASKEASRLLEELADEVICLAAPSPFGAVGQYYQDFAQVPDQAVTLLLGQVKPPGRVASRG
jgi:putative phosphoribosyl transferase